MVKLDNKQKMVTIAVLAAVLLYLAFVPSVAIPERGENETMSVVENRVNDVDCNACANDNVHSVSFINPDISRTYFVWHNGLFVGEYTGLSEVEGVCKDQIIACYSDVAGYDYYCSNERVKAVFACEDQVVKLK